METKKKTEDQDKSTGSSKEKASFDQNGSGASDKFGQAGSVPNESGKQDGPGTVKKDQK